MNFFQIYQYGDQKDLPEIWKNLAGNRKRIMVIGNCQSVVIQQLLEKNIEFREKYILLSIPALHQFSEKQKEIFERNIGENIVDYVIMQPVKSSNKWDYIFSLEHIQERMPRERIIVIPVLYFDVYFPQATAQKNNVLQDDIQHGVFPYGDGVLDELSQKYSIREILEIISSEAFLKKVS